MAKTLYEIDTSSQIDKPFWHNLHHYWCITLSFDRGNAARIVNDAKKSFMK
jgi:hypothetical protein